MEYSLAPVTDRGTWSPHTDPFATAALQQLPADLYRQNSIGFTANGARIYADIGAKLEYATPECVSYGDTVHAMLAGEQLVVAAVGKALQNSPELRNIQLLGRVVDKNGITWGHHENYLVRRRAFRALKYEYAPNPALRLAMLGHLASRTIFTGAGILVPNSSKPGGLIVPAQKIPHLTKEITVGTTSADKGLLNTRDEPHAKREKWARLHVTSGDYNISPWASWLKIGTTALVAYLAEVGYLGGEPADSLPPGDGLVIARAVGINPDQTFALADGSTSQAVDLQEKYCLAAQKFNTSYPDLLTEEDRLVIAHWQAAIDDWRRDRDSLQYRVDWITRQKVLENYIATRKPTDSDKIIEAEKAWDDLVVGSAVKLRHATKMPGYDEAAIERLKHQPPTGSRAELRGRLIRDYADRELAVDWGHVTITSTAGTRITIGLKNNPFQSQLTANQKQQLSWLGD